MSECDMFCDLLAEWVADGEPESVAYAGLRRHMQTCPQCSVLLPPLRRAEEALRAYPTIQADPALLRRIIEAISLEQLPEIEQWRLLPWDVWVPAVAVGGALLILLYAVPTDVRSMAFLGAAPAPQVFSGDVEGRLAALRALVDQDRFWAIWSAAALMLSGAGLKLFLSRWDEATKRQVDRFEEQVSDAANRIVDLARRTR